MEGTCWELWLLGRIETLVQGCQTHFHWGHISLVVAFKGPNVISTPEQLRSNIYTVLKLFQSFEGNRKIDVAPSENEFDTYALYKREWYK